MSDNATETLNSPLSFGPSLLTEGLFETTPAAAANRTKLTIYLKPDHLPAKANAFFDLADIDTNATAWIIDPGLAHKRGHHYALDHSLLKAIRNQRQNVSVLCQRSFPAEPGFIPCFQLSTFSYSFTARSPDEVDVTLAATAKAFHDDLSHTLGETIQSGDVLLLPSAHIAHIAGLASWLASLPPERRPRIAQLHFQMPPDHGVFGHETIHRVFKHVRAHAHKLDASCSVRWSANHPRLAALYSKHFELSFQAITCPHEVPSGMAKIAREDDRLRFLFIGQPRPEKGFPLILDALPRILAQTSHCDFRFVLPAISDPTRAFLLGQTAGRVSIRVEDGLPEADYFAELAQADFILCVYDPVPYHYRNSGIANEAAQLDVPIIITQGMAVEDDVADFSRVHVLPHNPQALLELCLSLDQAPDHGNTTLLKKHASTLEHTLRQAAALESAGRVIEAERLYRDLLAIDPHAHSAWHALGLLAFNAGNQPQAIQCIDAAIACHDKSALYHRNIGEMHRRMSQLDKAIQSGRRACKLAPGDLDAHYNLGLAYTDAKDYTKAIDAYRKALKLNPRHGLSWNNLGSALEQHGDKTEAQKAYAKAVKLNPQHAEAQNNLGAIDSEQGKLDEARACFEAAIAAKPDFVEAHFNLSSLKTYKQHDPHLAMLEAVYQKRHTLSDHARIRYGFALGKALDDIGQNDRAFAAYEEGNRLQHAILPMNEAHAEAMVERIIQTFDAGFFSARKTWKGNAKSPIFIVGMPRSGTTLLEQILCSHASVHGAGELPDLNAVITSATGANAGRTFTEGVVALSEEDMRRIGDAYVKRVWKLSPKSAFITDKMPANFFYLGLIHLALPNAKIIHAMRDPMDSCFSCFTKLFNDTMEFAYDQGTLGRYYTRYMKLMEHWHKVLPAGSILDLRYEDMVADTEGQSRRVLEFVGLPWDDNCLKFHENTRLVKTASVAQVRQPIYQTSVARWKRFAPHLQPLYQIVKGFRTPGDEPALPMTLSPAGKVNPQAADAIHLEGIALYHKGQIENALACYDRALALHPDLPTALNSKGFALQDMDRMKEALVCFERAVELAPEFAMARLNLGMAQLKLGDWDKGWDNYEARWAGSAEAKSGALNRPVCPLPQWTGQPNTEKLRLLIVTEQGFGDTFQFSRYLTLAAARFGKVGFVCSQPTLRLMEWAFNHQIVLFNRMPAQYDAWDLQCPLMSLPCAFGTRPDTIPGTAPYLQIPGKATMHWRERLESAAPGRFRVGIAWAGRKAHQCDARRSLSFLQILPLLQNESITWVSLQKWAPEDARPSIPDQVDWLDWTDELTDFADTAALVSNLDLVISIDSSMVHLAGALNRPVWMMNRFDSEWRWLRHREDSPWYPSLRLFNQPAFGDWTSVLTAVQGALKTLSVPQQPAKKKPRAAPAAAPATAPSTLSASQAMQLASQHQSAGRLQEAESVLRQILQAHPQHAHALHLLGVITFQAGKADQGLQLVGQALAIESDSALFHSNFAEMSRQQGHLEEAVHHGRRAIELDPAMASAHSNLGIALYDAQDYEAAEACHRQALALVPNLLQSLNNLGSVERVRKNRPGAIEWYRKALAISPDYLESLSNLGAVLVEEDQADDAVPVLEKALRLQPNYYAALCNLGLARLKQDALEDAAVLLQRSLQLNPGYTEALLGLAKVLHEQDRLDEAKTLLRQALDNAPDKADAWCHMGSLCMAQELTEEAEAAYHHALDLDPQMADALNGLGNLRLEQGKIDASADLLMQAIAIDPDHLGARFHLTQTRKVKPGDANLAALEKTLDTIQGLSTDKQISLHYALGKAYDDLKEYDKGFPHFIEGARLKRAKLNYDPQTDTDRRQQIMQTIDRDFIRRFADAGDPSDVPIFVLGMPRSGTTLTEQIIASHPAVHGAGELRELMEVIHQPGKQQIARPFSDNLAHLTPETVATWGREYVTRLRKRAPDAPHITDKMPANYMAMGLIPLILPHAKIIHVRRNPVDTCVSCFTRLFNRHQDATYDLAELGHHYANYARLMQHWRNVLPAGSFYEVQYEDVVADTEGEARKLLNYCGLEWDAACLDFHKHTRNIRTASVTQVRQPIYSSSVERWRHYEQFLGPLLAALGEFAPTT